MDAHTYERDEEAGSLTPERARIANGSLQTIPIFENPNSRVIIGHAHLIASPIRKMFDDGKIGQEELDAVADFHRDFTIGMASPCVTAKYGKSLGVGGTPLSQMTAEAFAAQSIADRRTECHNRYIRACDYINHAPTAYWFTLVACEVPIGDPGKVPSLEDVGRKHYGFSNRPQATAAAYAMMRHAIDATTEFYNR